MENKIIGIFNEEEFLQIQEFISKLNKDLIKLNLTEFSQVIIKLYIINIKI